MALQHCRHTRGESYDKWGLFIEGFQRDNPQDLCLLLFLFWPHLHYHYSWNVSPLDILPLDLMVEKCLDGAFSFVCSTELLQDTNVPLLFVLFTPDKLLPATSRASFCMQQRSLSQERPDWRLSVLNARAWSVYSVCCTSIDKKQREAKTIVWIFCISLLWRIRLSPVKDFIYIFPVTYAEGQSLLVWIHFPHNMWPSHPNVAFVYQ